MSQRQTPCNGPYVTVHVTVLRHGVRLQGHYSATGF